MKASGITTDWGAQQAAPTTRRVESALPLPERSPAALPKGVFRIRVTAGQSERHGPSGTSLRPWGSILPRTLDIELKCDGAGGLVARVRHLDTAWSVPEGSFGAAEPARLTLSPQTLAHHKLGGVQGAAAAIEMIRLEDSSAGLPARFVVCLALGAQRWQWSGTYDPEPIRDARR